MLLPAWAFFGLSAALFSSVMMLLQERFRLNGYAMAFWIKAGAVSVTLPFVIWKGAPTELMFYVYLALTAVIYAINDVIFFEGINKTGAGAVARLVPSASIFSFLIWFMIQPSLLADYLEHPFILAAIFGVLCLFAFFAFRLKKCTVTMKTFKAIWYVLLAATIGPIFSKLASFHAPKEIVIYSYVFFQAAMMMALWLIYLAIRRPVPVTHFISKDICLKGMTAGLVASGMLLTKFISIYYVDNPAYIPAMISLDAVIILFFYKLRGKPIEGDIVSGLGIVACAAMLIILKAQI